MIVSILNKNTESNSQLQIDSINILYNLFYKENIHEFKDKSYFFKGVRGNFDGAINYTICFEFYYFSYFFEFYLSYDQLEYYIFIEGNLLKECNLEDFWEEKTHINKFINYLKKDLKKLKIPFNQ